MLRGPLLALRATHMSAGNPGQVATALKSVLERVDSAAQRSGRNSQVEGGSNYLQTVSPRFLAQTSAKHIGMLEACSTWPCSCALLQYLDMKTHQYVICS